MSIKIDGDWSCPQCGAMIEISEEAIRDEVIQSKYVVMDQIKRMGYGEIDCQECLEPLTADTRECAEGMVDINEDWTYD